jgi:hypothetical protein
VNSLAAAAQPQRQQFAMNDRLKSQQQQTDAGAPTRLLNPGDAPAVVQPKVRPLNTGKNATAAMMTNRSTTNI